ncbi:MAG: pneumococcal-type histidine triad protein [Facklamia hominis]
MKYNKLILTSTAVLGLGLATSLPLTQAVLAQSSNRIQYVDDKEEEKDHDSNSNHEEHGQVHSNDPSQQAINEAEGIASEQIVVQIDDEGYITSHGDHYHYYNGEVPADSIFSEDLLTPSGYQLNKEDIISKTDEGYIVKVENQYYLYLEDSSDAKNVRSVEELTLQSFGIHPDDAKRIKGIMDQLGLEDDTSINYEFERSPEEVAESKEIESDFIVLYLTENEYVTIHGLDLYIFPGQAPENSIFAKTTLADSTVDLSQAEVLYNTKSGQVVKLEDRVYFMPNESNKPLDLMKVKEAIQKAKDDYKAKGIDHAAEVKKEEKGGIRGGSGSRNANGQYVTDDGYVFSPNDVIRFTGNGFIVPHGDHFHFIPLSDLSAAEKAQAFAKLGMSESGANSHSQTNSKGNDLAAALNKIDELNKKASSAKGSVYTTDDGYVFTPESIVSFDANGMVCSHGNHFHYVPFADLSRAELAAAKAYIQKHLSHLKTNEDANSSSATDKKDMPSTPSQEMDSSMEAKLRKLYSLPISQRYHEGDGLVFDPKAVTGKNSMGYVHPHGDHYHVIKPSDLSPLELELVEYYLNGSSSSNIPSMPSKDESGQESSESNSVKPSEKPKEESPQSNKGLVDFLAMKIKKSALGQDGKAYTTDDGFKFTPESIQEYTSDGLVCGHGNHLHYVPFTDLDDNELKAAQDYINANKVAQSDNTHKESPEDLKKKLAYLALKNGVKVEDIEVKGDIVNVPHEGHFHTYYLSKTPTKLSKNAYQADDEHKEFDNYENYVMQLKREYFKQTAAAAGLLDPQQPVMISRGGMIGYYDPAGNYHEQALNSIKLPIEYDEVDFKVEDKQEVAPSPAPEKESENKPVDKEKPENKEERVPVKDLKAFLAQAYQVDIELISYFRSPEAFYIQTKSGNIKVDYAVAVKAYRANNKSLLPNIEKPDLSVEEHAINQASEQAEEEENESSSASSQNDDSKPVDPSKNLEESPEAEDSVSSTSEVALENE